MLSWLLVAALAVAGPPPAPTEARMGMVEQQLRARGIKHPEVLRAMQTVPREAFVREAYKEHAYGDHPLPIGPDATISQPYIVALMTVLADVKAGDKVLEVGTGSGYQAAILAELGATVFTIELQPELSRWARKNLAAAGYGRVQAIVGDGYAGWPADAPYDAILVTAAPEEIPPALLAQLADGGRLVIPVGGRDQDLIVVTRRGDTLDRRSVTPVSFVPLKKP
jgi:protein-L-isoaspartate(D-aspartate) O-methyltransferase